MAERGERVLVTGGGGFIGRRLSSLLARRGCAVVSADLTPLPDNPEAGTNGVEPYQIDLTDAGEVRRLFAGDPFTRVFDLASITQVGLAAKTYSANVAMTRNVVDCVKSQLPQATYIFFSTQFVFRRPNRGPETETDYFPVDDYGASKVQSELIVRGALAGRNWIITRPSYVWGVGLERFKWGLLYRLARGQLLVPRRTAALRYYGYVDTVALQALELSRRITADSARRMYYLSDEAISLFDFAHAFSVAGLRRTPREVPSALLRLGGLVGSALKPIIGRSPIDRLQAREMTATFPIDAQVTLQLTGESTDLEQAAAETVAWVLSDPAFRTAVGLA